MEETMYAITLLDPDMNTYLNEIIIIIINIWRGYISLVHIREYNKEQNVQE